MGIAARQDVPHADHRGIGRALRGEVAATPASLLVPLRPGGRRTPLFCVPGVGSHVFTFRELAERLPGDRPILGLEVRGMDGRGSPHTRIEPMAAEYVAEIRRQHPKGPYHLAGYSLGGLVVFEMARQLAALGNPMGIVAILDAHVPGHPRRFRAVKRLQIHASKFAALSWCERCTYIGERVSNRLGRSDRRSDYEVASAWRRGVVAIDCAASSRPILVHCIIIGPSPIRGASSCSDRASRKLGRKCMWPTTRWVGANSSKGVSTCTGCPVDTWRCSIQRPSRR